MGLKPYIQCEIMHQHSSFFQSRQKGLMIASTVYVIALIVSHSALPPMHVWIIAAAFSIIMNFTYITEACYQGRLMRPELAATLTLISASVLGVIVHPLFVVFAIVGHGLWDVAKHFGAGIPFFSWYTLGCFAVDITYATVLLTYWSLN